jgi:hypothetical protein
MTEKRGNRVRRILESKRQPPEYQRLDIEPKEGGRSLLHDDFGLPRVSPTLSRGDVPQMREVSNKPVTIKASVPDESKIQIARGGIPQKGRPARAAEQTFTKEEDDGFIPPKNNFVNVGQIEHAWYDDKVAGPSEMVDNNHDVDADGLQGANPLADVEPEVSEIQQQYKQRLQYIQDGVISQLEDVVSLEDLEQFKANILGRNGVVTSVLRQFKKLEGKDRQVVGEMINSVIENLKLEFESKEYEFLSDDDETPQDEEDETEDLPPETPDTGKYSSVFQPVAKISAALAEGQWAIFVDDKMFTVVDSAQEARQTLTRLILGNNIDVQRIQLIKRIPIDFGVVLYED